MRFFLTGFMGSGKTFWAKKLSNSLAIPSIDIDEYIEWKENKTIPEIIDQQGEEYFRQLENLCLKEIVSTYHSVIVACGGGTPCFYDNKKILKATGKIIFLEVDIDTLTKRLSLHTEHRFLLKNQTANSLPQFIATLLTEREKHYQDYDIKVKANLINEATFVNLLKQYV